MGELAAIILAAGMSSRMREFKPLLELGEKTIVSRVVRLATELGAKPVIVVTGRRARDIEAHLAEENVIFVRNERYETTQMLDSLLLGFSKIPLECGRVLIMPADIPLVRRETIEQLLQTDGDFVRPAFKGKPGHPAVLSCELIPEISGYAGEGGLRGAITALGVSTADVETDDRGVLLDADTPEDYELLRRYYAEEYNRLE